MEFLFSYRGRMSRTDFWLAHLLAVVIAASAFMLITVVFEVLLGFIESWEGALRDTATAVFFIIGATPVALFVWSSFCIGIKRFHDRDKDGAWVLISFVPAIGGLWYLIEAGFMGGTGGSNRFGPDPRNRRAA